MNALGALFGGRWPEGRWPAGVLAAHGPPQRLPEALRSPDLASFDTLARRYRGPLSFGRGLRDPQTFDSASNAASLFKLGLTVYLRDVAPWVSGAPALLRALEHELGVAEGCARIGAFASPGDDGVSCHYDAEDVISVQLAGTKTFHVAPMAEIASPYGTQFGPDLVAVDTLFPQARGGFPDASKVRFEAVEMVPGSVLFLPRGTWHRTEAREDSFAVSIVLRPPAALDTLQQALQSLLLASPEWRAPIRGLRQPGPARDAERARLEGLLRGLPALLGALSADDLATDSLDERLARLTPASTFLRVPTSSLDIEPSTGGRARLTLRAWDQDWVARDTVRTEVPAEVAPAARWVADRTRAFSLADLASAFPALPAPARVQLLQGLVRGHFVRLLGPSLPDLSP